MENMHAVVLLFLSALGPVTTIRLDGNGYTDILIVISPAVPENEELLHQIKEMFLSGSEYLFEALDHKVFFKEVKILVPPTWTTGKYERATTESFSKGRIRIDSPHSVFDEPFIHQKEGCGKEAEYIHFTPNFFLNNNFTTPYGPRGKVFLREWAHLRWGVFDEYNVKQPFYWTAGQIRHTSCTDKISGQWYEIINQYTQPCQAGEDGLPTSSCQFLPDAVQNTNASIMYNQNIDSITAFCQEEEHNIEAPNEQNKKCGKSIRSVIFQDSVDKDALHNLKPLQSPPPAPTFKVIQRGTRVVCLILDVSGSMRGLRFGQLKEAATYFLNHIIDEQEFVALVTFSTEAQIKSNLTLIDGPASRASLIHNLPTTASGFTYICKALRKGFEALKSDDGKTVGDEIIFLTDGEATDTVQDCLQEAVQSGAIIHTIAFGPNATNVLITMANQTGGNFRVAQDSQSFNQLVNAFYSMTLFNGNPTTQPIQLESTGKLVTDWFNGTVSIDRTVGNRTTFTLIFKSSAPNMYLQSPSGLVYDQRNTTDTANTITLTVPGTAEPGDWKYSFFNRETASQQMSLIVMSRAAHKDVTPVTVTVRMNQQISDGSKPMVVMAEVSQNYNAVLQVRVSVNLESDTGHTEIMELFDNGAGTDAFKDDGVYSRYFTKINRGRYSLSVRVENQDAGVQVSSHRYTSALYVPGYIVHGKVVLNSPKPPANVQIENIGRFTRTATGESFVVEKDASSNFPPNKITDLIAEIQDDTVFLSWTAPGEDYDQGTAQSYEIRWSENLKLLQNNFESSNLFNTSTLLPQESGSAERHYFKLDITIENGTTVFFAVQSMDQQLAKSEVSNIARATKYVPSPRSPLISSPYPNLTAIIVSVCAVTIVACVIAVIIWRQKRQSQS